MNEHAVNEHSAVLGNPFAYCNYRVGLVPLTIVWIILMAYGFSQGWQLTLFLLVFMLIAFIWQILSSFFTSLAVGRRQRCEGDLRLHLGRVLQNVESITFFGGQEQELGVAEDLLQKVFWAKFRYNSFANATSIPTVTIYYWLQTGIYVMSAILAQWWSPAATRWAMEIRMLHEYARFFLQFACAGDRRCPKEGWNFPPLPGTR